MKTSPNVLRIDFRYSGVRRTINSLPTTIRPFLNHALDNPKTIRIVDSSISRLEGAAAGKA